MIHVHSITIHVWDASGMSGEEKLQMFKTKYLLYLCVYYVYKYIHIYAYLYAAHNECDSQIFSLVRFSKRQVKSSFP